MTRFILVLGLSALAACQPAETGISGRAALDMIIGRDLVNEAGTVRINQDGTATGSFNGQPVDMVWAEEDGRFCREGAVGQEASPRRCQTVRVTGPQARFYNADGSLSSSYLMN